MDIVAIDPSLTCTALVVNDKKFVYTGTHVAYTSKLKLKSWFEVVSHVLTIRDYNLNIDKTIKYSESELIKFANYRKMCSDIISDILACGANLSTAIIGIEGYSYSSSAGPLIDLVTFGSILRQMLLDNGATNIIIIPPQELKTKAASMVYPCIKRGKVIRYENNNGVPAGSFKKQDMLQCLLDDVLIIHDEWVDVLKEHSVELLALKATPKPIEDVNDSKLLYEWLKRKI